MHSFLSYQGTCYWGILKLSNRIWTHKDRTYLPRNTTQNTQRADPLIQMAEIPGSILTQDVLFSHSKDCGAKIAIVANFGFSAKNLLKTFVILKPVFTTLYITAKFLYLYTISHFKLFQAHTMKV